MAPKHITFLYGTETGVSEEFCFLVASIAANNGIRVTVLPVDDFSLDLWGCSEAQMMGEQGAGGDVAASSSPIVFFVSTAGQGEMPLTMKRTWDCLRMSDAPDLSALRFAVFGLGDSTYSKFNYAAKMFHNRLQQLGGEAVVHRGLGDERDGKGVWQELEPWLGTLWSALGVEITDASLVIPDNNKFTVAFEQSKDVTHERSASESDNAAVSAAPSPASVGHRPGCWDFVIKSNTRLTAPNHFQHVSYVEFERDADTREGDEEEGVPHGKGYYAPGDCVAVYPTNSPAEVARVLKALHITPADADTRTVVVRPNTSGWPNLVGQPNRFFMNRPITIRELLTRFVDLEGTASQAFLRMFSASAIAIKDDELVERMRDLGTPKNVEDYNRFAYREKRTMSEVMEDFPLVPVTLSALVSHAPLMRPRYYSISSSPTMDARTVGLTVALFELKTPLGRERKGLCSRWLCGSKEGDAVEGFFLHRPFVINPKAPLILIGPGTGVAPLRGIIRERWALAQQQQDKEGDAGATPPEMILFFGCRNKEGDFLHGDEWAQFAPSLKVVTAFSRDDATGKKEYVQHKLIDDSAAATKVFKLLTNTDEALYGGGAVVIICGNAKHMPNSVQDALASILAAGKGITKEEALVEVNRLRIRNRIKFETWSV